MSDKIDRFKKALGGFASKLRSNQTDTENFLWKRLRNRQFEGFKFKRQQPIGPFIVDFVNCEKKVIIELDGSQHIEKASEDRDRDLKLGSLGYRVLRFWDNEIFQNTEAVLEAILEELRKE